MPDGDDGDNSWVGDAYRRQLSRQTYGQKQPIEGVELIDLVAHADEGGDFCEVARLVGDGKLSQLPDFRTAQISYSLLVPGTIKAWHLHHEQTDLWFVPPSDRLLVGLLDVRDGSPTYQANMRVVMGAGTPRLLRIPSGVAHGAVNLSDRPASIIYLTDRAFNPQQPDEYRLPYDLLGADFWTIRPG